MKTNIKWGDHKWAIFYCGVSTFGALCFGYDQIYFTGVQGMQAFIDDYGIVGPDGTKALTPSFLSLTAAIIYVGEFVGAVSAAPINDYFGRRAVFLTASIAIIIGALVQLFAHGSEGILTLGRIFIGIGIGEFTVTCLLYVGEVAPTAVRGPALSCFQFLQSISQLVGSGITQGTSVIPNHNAYFIPFGFLIVLPGLMLLCLPFLPESPAWYAMKDKFDGAERSLRKINRSMAGYDPERDMQNLRDVAEREKEMAAESSWLDLLRDPIERRKVTYSAGAMFAQQICGIQFFYSYGVVFAQSLGVAQPFTISLITNILQVVAVGASVYLSNRISRRYTMLFCTLGIFVALLVVGGIGTTRNADGTFSNGVSYAIVVFSYLVIICFNFSLGTMAFVINSECAVGRNRNKIVSVAFSSFVITVFVISFTAPYLYYTANLGPQVGFVYAALTILSLTYIWFCVGETSGRTTAEIERFFTDNVPVRQWKTHVFEPIPSEKVDDSEKADDLGPAITENKETGRAAGTEHLEEI